MKGGYPSDNDNVMETNSTEKVYLQNKDMLKDIVFKKSKDDDSELLKEDNIKDLGK